MYKSTTTTVSTHLSTENPIYGESVITVSVDDESGGVYIVLQSNDEAAKEGQIRLDLDQLELIAVEARRLIEEYDAANCKPSADNGGEG